MSSTPTNPRRPEIIAHRGYSAIAPENTLPALDAALEAGATAIEVDLRTAIDGTPVLFHDVHLGRTTSGVGPVRRRTLGQLKSLDAGSWFSKEFEEERIPTLAEALERLDGRLQRFYPEIKGYREMEDLDRMVEIVTSAGMLERTTFLAADTVVLDRIRDTEPSVALGIVVEGEEGVDDALERAVRDRRTFVDLDVDLALESPAVVRTALERDVEVGVWTVDDPENAERLWDLGVTRFTTDRVAELLAWADGAG